MRLLQHLGPAAHIKPISAAVYGIIFCLNVWGGPMAGAQDSKLYCEYVPPAEIAVGKKMVLLSGDEEYRSEEALPMLGKVLSQRFGFHCLVLFAIDPETGEINPDHQTNIPGMAFLEDADLVILAWRFRNLPDADMKHFVDYVERGKPIIALRTATHAFNLSRQSAYRKFSYNYGAEWPGGFGKQILGETWVSHHGNHGTESTRGVIVPEQHDHPILRGVNDIWGPSDVYGINDLPADAVPIVLGQILNGMEPTSVATEGDRRNDPMMPLVWVRERAVADSDSRQRIVTSTIGAASDFEHGDLTRLIVNAAYWCLEMEDSIDPDRDVSPVDLFKPTPFGFKKFIQGKTPADYDLKQ